MDYPPLPGRPGNPRTPPSQPPPGYGGQSLPGRPPSTSPPAGSGAGTTSIQWRWQVRQRGILAAQGIEPTYSGACMSGGATAAGLQAVDTTILITRVVGGAQ